MKILLAGLSILVILLGVPMVAALVVTMGTQAAAECRTQADQAVDAGVPSELGDLGVIEGPVGGSVEGQIGVASANIPTRSGADGFRASMPQVLSTDPDFVTLSEQSARSLDFIESAAPGYSAYRAPPESGADASESMSNVVLWKRDVWTLRNSGRVKIVDDDQAMFEGRPVTWDRHATWALLERKSDGAVVSIIAVHHMTNPHKFPGQHGTPPLTRAQQYGQGMDILLQLANSLATHGPVLIGGDMNSHSTYTNLSWSAVVKMSAAGYGWYDHSVDFVFFPQYQGVKLAQGWTGPMASDHQWVAGRLDMNGAGPTAAPEPATTTTETTTETTAETAASATTAADTLSAAVPDSDVPAQVMQLRLTEGYPTITTEQATNAVVIAQVARDLNVPRRGLEIAIAVAIQESKLVNLTGGDRDSRGLFQQRRSADWGTRTQITSPRLAAEAFFGEAQHTNNPGLLDIPNWEQLPLTLAAQAVQQSGYPDAYARWEPIAQEIAALLGGGLPDVETITSGSDQGIDEASAEECAPTGDIVAPVTLGSFNILGAGHTDGKAGGGNEHAGFAGWEARLPQAIDALETQGVTIAGLQEVHGGQENALAARYGQKWGMYPESGQQNKVIWDRNSWEMTDARLVQIPYFKGNDVGMPLVQLTSPTTGQSIWVWSIHNPANTHGDARQHRVEALRRELDTMSDLKATGVPVVILGDFNDDSDGQHSSHCTLTPTVSNAFGGSAEPCQEPAKDAPIDHIYGANLTWASASVDNNPQANRISDHPLVIATTAGSSAGCAVTDSVYNLGPVKPQLTHLVNVLGPMFDIETVGGYRESATDPHGHPAGLAADFMVPLTPAGKAQGDALVAYAQQHATELGIDYIIWYQRIWSVEQAAEGWRPMEDRGSATEDHLDHPHIQVLPDPSSATGTSGTGTVAGSGSCGEVVYPVPAQYVGNDAHNWHDSGRHWSSWHSGTDFGAPCGTPVYAAHAGTIEVDTTQGWSGPWLVKVTNGPGLLTTWYAHMEQVTVSRGETVQPGQQIGVVGEEGNSDGCHLHFEVHLENGSIYGPDNVDPSTWLAENASRRLNVAA